MEEFKGELGEGFGLRSEADDEAQRTPGSPGENGSPSLTEGRIGFQQGPQQRLTEGQLIARAATVSPVVVQKTCPTDRVARQRLFGVDIEIEHAGSVGAGRIAKDKVNLAAVLAGREGCGQIDRVGLGGFEGLHGGLLAQGVS